MSEFPEIFGRLRNIFQKYEANFNVIENSQNRYSLEGSYSEKFQKNLWFGAVELRKNYVSYHLMPVYMYKELTEAIPEKLKKRMHGKSCFNFKSYDEELFDVLETLSDRCFEEFLKRGDKV